MSKSSLVTNGKIRVGGNESKEFNDNYDRIFGDCGPLARRKREEAEAKAKAELVEKEGK